MIKNIDHARKVCQRRRAAGLKGLPRSVTRFLTTVKKPWEVDRASKAKELGLI